MFFKNKYDTAQVLTDAKNMDGFFSSSFLNKMFGSLSVIESFSVDIVWEERTLENVAVLYSLPSIVKLFFIIYSFITLHPLLPPQNMTSVNLTCIKRSYQNSMTCPGSPPLMHSFHVDIHQNIWD